MSFLTAARHKLLFYAAGWMFAATTLSVRAQSVVTVDVLKHNYQTGPLPSFLKLRIFSKNIGSICQHATRQRAGSIIN